jgi:5-methylcytosine-specific restriction protein A
MRSIRQEFTRDRAMALIKHLIDAAQGKHPIGAARSSRWPTVRKKHLELHPTCEMCGGSEKLEVHHIRSFVEHPELELEPSNMISLCEANANFNCHRIFGHLNNFQQINPNVVTDTAEWNAKLRNAKQEMAIRKRQGKMTNATE